MNNPFSEAFRPNSADDPQIRKKLQSVEGGQKNAKETGEKKEKADESIAKRIEAHQKEANDALTKQQKRLSETDVVRKNLVDQAKKETAQDRQARLNTKNYSLDAITVLSTGGAGLLTPAGEVRTKANPERTTGDSSSTETPVKAKTDAELQAKTPEQEQTKGAAERQSAKIEQPINVRVQQAAKTTGVNEGIRTQHA